MKLHRWEVVNRNVLGVIVTEQTFLTRRAARRFKREIGGVDSVEDLKASIEEIKGMGWAAYVARNGVPDSYTSEIQKRP